MDRISEKNQRSEIGNDLPDSMERRLVLRLLKYWRQLLAMATWFPLT